MSAIALPVRQDSPEWPAYRASLKGLGASDAAVVLGISPYRSAFELWEQLTGRTSAPEETDRMARGKRFEALARAWVAERTGWRIVQVHRTIRDPRWPHLFCHLDGRFPGRHRTLQIKTRWANFEDVPLHVQAQVQMEMALAHATEATVAVMTFEDLFLHEVPFEPETAYPMLDRLEAWYVRHVVGDEPPIDDSDAYRRYLGATSPEGEARDATSAEIELIDGIRLARKAAASAENEEAELKSRLMESMAGTSELLGQGFHLTWRRSKGRTKVDWKGLAALPEVVPFVAGFTTIEEGARPFRLVFEGE